ncbi:TolC family protein [Ideonella sp. YS5]|uniref:TolC family protein n=1 Tax=Ideonella sp. YS5 TaxID=3453714 RepID=UPI003EEC85EF
MLFASERASPFVAYPALALAAAALLTTACAAIPEPRPPSIAAQATPAALPGGEGPWWQDFGCPALDHLIATALRDNHDLRIAAARVKQARALADGAQADRLPQLGLAASAGGGRDSAADPKARVLAAGLRASWEPDLFGRLAAAGDAAEADAQSTERARQALEIGLAAEVATAYFEAATLARREALARGIVASLDQALGAARRRFDAGQLTRLDLDRLQAEWRSEQAAALQLAGARQVRLKQLALLIGRDELPEVIETPEDACQPAPPPDALDADLLARRPDVQQQASAAQAALLRLGMARRDVYPRIQFDWSGRDERLAIEGGSTGSTVVIGYGVSLTLPLLDGGRIRANIAARDAQADEALQAYERSMLSAMVEAKVVLLQYATATASAADLQQAADSASSAALRARRLFEAGQASVDTVLDAERSQLRARDALAQADGSRLAAAVAIRRAFAGRV